jgi:hypothetical protein
MGGGAREALERVLGCSPEEACAVWSERPNWGLKADPGRKPLTKGPLRKASGSERPRIFAGLFRERLKGFEPSTFCMASSTRISRSGPNNPANKRFSAPARARRNTRHSPRDHGGFRTQTGPSLVVSEPRGNSQACAQETAQSAAFVAEQEPPSALLVIVRGDSPAGVGQRRPVGHGRRSHGSPCYGPPAGQLLVIPWALSLGAP